MSIEFVVQVDGAAPVTMIGSEVIALAFEVLSGNDVVVSQTVQGPVVWLNPLRVQILPANQSAEQSAELRDQLRLISGTKRKSR